MRLSPHGARNYHRAALLYLLVEGLMSDLFLLITQEGLLGRVQCISLGYNLAGIMSMVFEMVETMNWMGEKTRCLVKRLLFNYETALVGELICSGLMQQYLTSLNRSSLKDSSREAEKASYYVMSLVGHGAIALGCVLVITSARVLGAIGFVRWKYGSLAVLAAPCSVDATLGVRCKQILLGGYAWKNGELFYKVETLKKFGIVKVVEEDGDEFLAHNKVEWGIPPRDDLVVIGAVADLRAVPCKTRVCSGVVSMFDRVLGGGAVEARNNQQHVGKWCFYYEVRVSALGYYNTNWPMFLFIAVNVRAKSHGGHDAVQ
ncbi:hypothetical protein BBJ28_00016389 [Nothophytophthora sp. Chile5]|nr:hypothetical protein BBJ28_00016389 [Nothophytophthora sp. Chile5]